MPADARPTVPAPDDDPHLRLEEIEGARALAWVEHKIVSPWRRSATLRLPATATR
jgi:prolyl oligopeptidase